MPRADATQSWKKQPDKGRLYTRIMADIRQLEQSVAALQRTCQRVARTRDLNAFRKLGVEAGDTLSFITILAAKGEGLDEAKRPATLIRLAQLRQTVTELHIRSVEPVLQALVGHDEPMGLGVGYVMEKWVAHLDLTAQDVGQAVGELERLRDAALQVAAQAEAAPAGDGTAPLLQRDAAEAAYLATVAGYGRVTGAIVRSRVLAQQVVQSAPSLPDFTNGRQEQVVQAYLWGPPPDVPGAKGAVAVAGNRAAALPGPGQAGASASGTLYLVRREGKLYIDPEMSADAVKSLRGKGLMEELAKRVDMPRHKLTTLLAGRDGINFTFLTKLKNGVEGVTGVQGVKVEVLQV
ncbi:MAG: hypothetical protein PW843_07265 [Azospirillaceae bacterium]|nr:hypothetical protein [Azospirillaceae bacterium]